jgi:hypothetical protein
MDMSIGGPTKFQGQRYSSCSKADVRRAAQLLGGFHRNLSIVSRLTPTPGCTANFPGNSSSQQLILRPFGRSGQVLPAGNQVEARFINFSRIRESMGICGQSNDFTARALLPKSYENHIVKNQLFMFLPLLVWRPGLNSSQDSREVSQEIFLKNQKLTKL